MNRLELISTATTKSGFNHREISHALDAIIDTITEAVTNGNKVYISGFGTFEKAERPARTARNPRTGEAIDVPAKFAPTFKPSAAFKTQVNG